PSGRRIGRPGVCSEVGCSEPPSLALCPGSQRKSSRNAGKSGRGRAPSASGCHNGSMRLTRTPRWMVRAVTSTAAVAVVALLGFAGILALVGHDDPWVLLLIAPVVVVPLAIGSLIVWRRHGNAVGWVLIADAALLGLAFAVEPYARYALVTNVGSLPGGR